MAGFLDLLGGGMLAIGAAMVWLMFSGLSTNVFVESATIALFGFGGLILAAAGALRRLDKIVAQTAKPEAAE